MSRLTKKVSDQANELTEKTRTICQLEAQLEAMAGTGGMVNNASVESELREKTRLCRHLEKRVGELSRECTTLRGQVATAEATVRSTQQQQQSKVQTSGPYQTKLISSLKQELDAVKTYLKSYQGQLHAAKHSEESLMTQ